MNSSELVQAFMVSDQKIDSLWNFFVTVHMAIYGFLFFIKRLKVRHLIISSVAYLGFTIINLRAKLDAYNLHEALLLDIKKLGIKSADNLYFFMTHYDIGDRAGIVWGVHIFSLCAFLYLLCALNKFKAHEEGLRLKV